MLIRSYIYILFIKICLLGIGLVLLAKYTFSPQKAQEYVSPIIIILDLSHSMNIEDSGSQDGPVSRLATARDTIEHLIDTFSPGHPIGLIGCDEDLCSYLIAATTDHDFIQQHISYLHTNTLQHKEPLTLELPSSYTYIFLTDGGEQGGYNSKVYATLAPLGKTVLSIGIGDTVASPIVDPQGVPIITHDIPQYHGKNEQSIYAISSSVYTLGGGADKDTIDSVVSSIGISPASVNPSSRQYILGSILIALGL